MSESSFSIVIIDANHADPSKSCMNIPVRSTTSVQEVKNALATLRKIPWDPSEALHFRETLLHDWKTMRELGVHEHSRITIKKGAINSSRVYSYECGNCHQIVFLGSRDDISCKACGGLVVYKLPAAKSYIYRAR
jgi:ribosomal protein S27E